MVSSRQPSTRSVAIALTLAFVCLPIAGPRAESLDPSTVEDLPEYESADPNAPAVTERNLLTSERFWPYHVALARPWQPLGGERAPAPGVNGVLIRVEESGRARIDFGRDGLFEVPVDATDLLERANRIRRGELEKTAPNYVLSIGTRLLDPSQESIPPLPFSRVTNYRYFLSVFADPSEKDFPALVSALAALREREGLLTILFPQGEHAPAATRQRLLALDWPVPFVRDYLSEPYTRSLLGAESPEFPSALLLSAEGRVLHRSRGSIATAEIATALERWTSARQGVEPAGIP